MTCAQSYIMLSDATTDRQTLKSAAAWLRITTRASSTFANVCGPL